MSRVVCPECYGRCCRLHGEHGGGAYVQHTEDPEEEFSRHVCRACWDGTVLASSLVPTPCSTCGGRCCVTGGNIKVEHGGGGFTKHYRHTCPDCKDGTRVPLLLMPTPAVEEERATIAAYLREQANAEHPIERGVPMLSPAGRGLLLLYADRIERGEHRREGDE